MQKEAVDEVCSHLGEKMRKKTQTKGKIIWVNFGTV
jgi:hypothetical protein